MRAFAIALTFALLAGSAAVAQDANPNDIALQKLSELRQRRVDMADRHRLAILIVNESNVPGAEVQLLEQSAVLFSSKGYEIANFPDATAVVAAHAKGAPWTPDELAAIAKRLQVETVAVGTLTHYQAHRKFGLPLPTMSVKTDADISMTGLVYKRTENQIVWQNAIKNRKTSLVNGGMISRNQARRQAGLATVDKLFNGFLSTKKS